MARQLEAVPKAVLEEGVYLLQFVLAQAML